jgi:hypothetical protein
MAEIQESLTEAPTGLDQALPGGGVERAGDGKSARSLERLNERRGPFAERLLDVVRRQMAEGGESLM